MLTTCCPKEHVQLQVPITFALDSVIVLLNPDWEVDTNPYVPGFDGIDSHPDCYQPLDKHSRNLYQLPDFTSGK